jgi:PEP-CTERM motif
MLQSGFPLGNDAAKSASKQRSISNIPEGLHLKRFFVIPMLALTLSIAAFADSSSELPGAGRQAVPPSAGNSAPIARNPHTAQFNSKAGMIKQTTILASIPEPGTLCLLGTGLLGLAGLMRRRLRAKQALPPALAQPAAD